MTPMTPAPEIDHAAAEQAARVLSGQIPDCGIGNLARAHLALAPRLAAAERALRECRGIFVDLSGRGAIPLIMGDLYVKEIDAALSASPPQSPENRAAPGRGGEEA